MPDDIKDILTHLVSNPSEHQIQIDFDVSKKKFFFSVPIYQTKRVLPRSIQAYVEARKNRTFKPHATSFVMESTRIVKLMQEIPFQWGVESNSRRDILDFLQLARRCHRMLYEIALEELYQEALGSGLPHSRDS